MSEPGRAGVAGSLRDRLGDHFGPAVVAGLIAIGMVAAAVIAVVAPIRGPDMVDRLPGAPDATVIPAPTIGPSTTTAPPATVPTLTGADDFARSNGPLGQTTKGKAWSTSGATFEVRDGQACTDARTGTDPAVAVVQTGSTGDVGVSAKVTKIAEGVGITFHYKDPSNYLALEAVPNVAAWRLVAVKGGAVVSETNLPLTTATDGVVIGVILSNGQAAVSADGVLSKIVAVPASVDPAGRAPG